MKLVIRTQVKENYGAHTWEGEGECPQHWKFKGGQTFVVENVDQYAGRCHPYVELLDLIEFADEYYEEYVIESSEIEDSELYCEEWEQDYVVRCTRNALGVWIAETKSASWVMMPKGEQTDFKVKKYIA
jgi:hypothetical protein